jgi:sterol desaturase/sphingolipid hydroxylase (fatty acid hydroxylase superfamily)
MRKRVRTLILVAFLVALMAGLVAAVRHFGLTSSCSVVVGEESLSRIKAYYDACVPFSFRLQIYTMIHDWPRMLITPFLDPYLYLVLLSILALEYLMPARAEQRVLSIGLFQDIAYFALHNFFTLSMVALVLNWLRNLYDHYLFSMTIRPAEDWPVAAKIVALVVVNDFLDWFHHLVRHKVWFFWQFHAVHHSQVNMNMFSDDRRHPMDDIIANLVVCIPMFMLSIDVPMAMYLVLILKWYPKSYHANIRSDLGLLRYVLVSPQHHRIHHSASPEHRDTNFGVIFSWWDRMFGTLYRNHEEYPVTGIGDAAFPLERSVRGFAVLKNYVDQLKYPFLVIARKVASGRSRTASV